MSSTLTEKRLTFQIGVPEGFRITDGFELLVEYLELLEKANSFVDSGLTYQDLGMKIIEYQCKILELSKELFEPGLLVINIPKSMLRPVAIDTVVGLVEPGADSNFPEVMTPRVVTALGSSIHCRFAIPTLSLCESKFLPKIFPEFRWQHQNRSVQNFPKISVGGQFISQNFSKIFMGEVNSFLKISQKFLSGSGTSFSP